MLSSCCGTSVSITEQESGCVIIAASGSDPVQICPGTTTTYTETDDHIIITIDGTPHLIEKNVDVASFTLNGNSLTITETDGSVYAVDLTTLLSKYVTKTELASSDYMTNDDHEASLVNVLGNDGSTVLFKAH